MFDLKHFNYDWQFLRDFFRIAYLRYLVTWFALVPIAVVVLSDLPTSIQITMPDGGVFTLTLALPFSWWLLWFSSLLYVVAWTLYMLASPRFIRRYTSYGAYQAWHHSDRWIIWEWFDYLKSTAEPRDVDILIEKGLATSWEPSPSDLVDPHAIGKKEDLVVYKPMKQAYETWFPFKRSDRYFRVGLGPNTKNKEAIHAELFWELYGDLAGIRSAVRRIIWLILYAAGLTFSIVVIQNIWAVLRYLWRQWVC